MTEQDTPRAAAKELHVIFGNGPVGSAAARYLLDKGLAVRMVSRSGTKPRVLFDDLPASQAAILELVSADARDRQATLRAAEGATHVYHCVNVLYQDWKEQLPPIQENIAAAARANRAVLAVSENLYMYARGTAVINEQTPEIPPTRKGKLRKRLHDEMVEAAGRDGLRWTAVRASDYYGPGATFQSMFGTQLFLGPLLNGGTPRVAGALDVPHTITYVQDYGRALAVAARDPRAWGRTWIVPNDRTLTARQAAQVFFDAAGRQKKLGVIPRPLIVVMGLFSRLLRELVEMLYQKEEPYVVDGSRFASLFDFRPTPLAEGARLTLEWCEKAGVRA